MTGLTVTAHVRFTRGRKGARELRTTPETPRVRGRVPRIARLMALAIHFDDLLRRGVVANYADLARLGQVTRARVSQIMALTNLAPDIQEAILHMPRVEQGRATLVLRDLLPVAQIADWNGQRGVWCEMA